MHALGMQGIVASVTFCLLLGSSVLAGCSQFGGCCYLGKALEKVHERER